MTNPFIDIFRLFFPHSCPVCGQRVSAEGFSLCTSCVYDMPVTGFVSRPDNPVMERFWGFVPLVNACSMFWFTGTGGYRDIIHSFKYRGGWKLALNLGRWLGSEMEQGGLYGDVDIIIPVPLHPLRRLRRGYNQSEYIAAGAGEELNRPVIKDCVVRRRYNKSQVRTERSRRWHNVEDIFAVRKAGKLSGKHILLVDDVLTTGATLISCAEAILRTVPDCRISIATLAVSQYEMSRKIR